MENNTETLQLSENLCIGHGATRKVYSHPFDKDKCIKVLLEAKNPNLLDKELLVYKIVKPIMGNCILNYGEEIINTNKGKALVCELLKDDDGEISKKIYAYVGKGKKDTELQQQLDEFVSLLINNKLYFYDFNLDNFVVQISENQKKLKYIDSKSYNKYKPWTYLKLECVSPFLAEHIMLRRLKRLYKFLEINFPTQIRG